MVIPTSAPPAKPALTFEGQADKMLQRGMIGDRATMIERLRYVNYYRLLGYSYPFRIDGDPHDRFVPGLHFETVWDDYVFDQKLRVVMMEAVAPASKWTDRVKDLIAEHPGVPLSEMEFHPRWRESPIWA